jgi:hypothetical protein
MNDSLELAATGQATPMQAAITMLDDIRKAANTSLLCENRYTVSANESWWWKHYGPEANPDKPDDYVGWDKSIEGGKGYLVGESVPTATFLQTHRSSCKPWQQRVFEYCKANPRELVSLRNNRLEYDCYWRGEYCVISLPHHDAGGERSWITRDGKSKILINVD